MKKEIKLVWYVYRFSHSENTVKPFNVFEHGSLMESIQKWWKKPLSKEEFAKKLRGELFYYYCSRCEHEIIMTHFPAHITPKELDRLIAERNKFIAENGKAPFSHTVDLEYEVKVDVYVQVMMNWEHFLEYVWGERTQSNKKTN